MCVCVCSLCVRVLFVRVCDTHMCVCMDLDGKGHISPRVEGDALLIEEPTHTNSICMLYVRMICSAVSCDGVICCGGVPLMK